METALGILEMIAVITATIFFVHAIQSIFRSDKPKEKK